MTFGRIFARSDKSSSNFRGRVPARVSSNCVTASHEEFANAWWRTIGGYSADWLLFVSNPADLRSWRDVDEDSQFAFRVIHPAQGLANDGARSGSDGDCEQRTATPVGANQLPECADEEAGDRVHFTRKLVGRVRHGGAASRRFSILTILGLPLRVEGRLSGRRDIARVGKLNRSMWVRWNGIRLREALTIWRRDPRGLWGERTLVSRALALRVR